jgi:hypothetical protein
MYESKARSKPGVRVRRQTVGHPFSTIKSWMATHFWMKEQRVEPQRRLQERLKNSFALRCVEPLCNGSRDRFEKTIDEEARAWRDTGSRMNSQMEDDRASRKSGLRQPLLLEGESIRLA